MVIIESYMFDRSSLSQPGRVAMSSPPATTIRAGSNLLPRPGPGVELVKTGSKKQ